MVTYDISINIYMWYLKQRQIIITHNEHLEHWFPTCGTRTPGGTRRPGWGVRKNNNGNAGKHTQKKKELK
jgi:hypothetical protein